VHPRIFQAFEHICRKRKAGGSVLEVGATADATSLLNMACLQGARRKVGLNLLPPARHADFEVVQGDGNCMDRFADQEFDTVLSNATLEHDRFFWKTVAEMKRVLKPGGLLVIGVPGYVLSVAEQKWRGRLQRLPLVSRYLTALCTSTCTFCVHLDGIVGDYYRFSEQACKEVFFAGMGDVETVALMTPPRIVTAGVKDEALGVQGRAA
jgi:SAM-dependent methyltransferase